MQIQRDYNKPLTEAEPYLVQVRRIPHPLQKLLVVSFICHLFELWMLIVIP